MERGAAARPEIAKDAAAYTTAQRSTWTIRLALAAG